ncbi:MAG: hypothetical protein ABEI75_01015 [Halobaculum sp.]
MSSPPDISSDEERDPYQDVYEQYWWHARHVENQIWSYTRIWAVVLTGIFAVVGSDLPSSAKAATALFGSLLSLLGFFVVYSLRIPFLAFALTSEVLAINEFGLPRQYRRFFKRGVDFRSDKGIDLPDILLAVYGIVGVALLVAAGVLQGFSVAGAAVGTVVGVGLAVGYFRRVRPKFTAEKRDAYDRIDED